jgi:hypothetical protein
MLTGSFGHPGIRAAIGVVVLVIGVALHRVALDVIGAVVIVLGAGQWLYASRKGGTGPSGDPGSGTGDGFRR